MLKFTDPLPMLSSALPRVTPQDPGFDTLLISLQLAETGSLIEGHYQPGLVAVSIGIAIVSAYAALDLAGRVAAARNGARWAWLWGGATAMGTGIWSMHYVAMLALRLTVPVRYDGPTVAASLLAAVFASAAALWVVGRRSMTVRQAVPGSVAMGLGIATMHYLGMEAMRLPAAVEYDATLVALSVVIAILVAFVAIWRSFGMRAERAAAWSWHKVFTAAYMGAAIFGMHYVGMAAATFSYLPGTVHTGAHVIESATSEVLVTLSSAVVLAIAIVASLVNRRFSSQAEALQDSERQREHSVAELIRLASFPEFDPSPVLEADLAGNLTYHNAAAAEHFPDKGQGAMHPALAPIWDAVARLQRGSASQVVQDVQIGDRVYEERLSLSLAGDRVIVYCVDITERLRAAEALGTQERFLRAIIDANPSLISVKDAEGRFTLANEAIAALHGVTPDQLLGRRESEFLDPNQAAALARQDEEVRGTRQARFAAEESRRDARTGFLRWYQEVKLPLPAPLEADVHVLAIATDITVRREAERRLHRDAQRLEATLEIQRSIGATSLDLEAIRRTIAERALALTGASGAAVFLIEGDQVLLKTGCGTAEKHHGLRVSRASRLARMWSADQEVFEIRDSETDPALNLAACRTLRARSAVLVSLHESGRLIGALAVTSTVPGGFSEDDVQGLRLVAGLLSTAETRVAEAAANAETEARFRLLADSVPVMIWTSNQHHACEYFNRHLLEFTGRTAEQETAADWAVDLHPDDAADGVARMGAAMAARRPYQLEYRRRRHDGVYRWILDVAVPRFTSSGEFLGYAGTCRDLTESKEAELALRQSQKLEAIGSLASGIAHEINTPVQYVSDNVRFLKGALADLLVLASASDALRRAAEQAGVAGTETDEVRRAADQADVPYLQTEAPVASAQALDGLQRITDIVRAVKQFSHPGSDQPVPTDLNAEITTTVAVSRNEWRYVADLEVRLDPRLPPVPCLAGEIRQVLLNLIVNASHAIADGAAAKAGDRGRIDVASRLDGDWVEITVTDSGIGIPEDVRSRIFDPFFTTKEVGRGTGQGLAIAHTIVVEKHRGTIRFDSVLGQGTTFVVRLPIQAPVAGQSFAA